MLKKICNYSTLPGLFTFLTKIFTPHKNITPHKLFTPHPNPLPQGERE